MAQRSLQLRISGTYLHLSHAFHTAPPSNHLSLPSQGQASNILYLSWPQSLGVRLKKPK